MCSRVQTVCVRVYVRERVSDWRWKVDTVMIRDAPSRCGGRRPGTAVEIVERVLDLALPTDLAIKRPSARQLPPVDADFRHAGRRLLELEPP